MNAVQKPRYRIAVGAEGLVGTPRLMKPQQMQAFDAGQSGRRMKALPTAVQDINMLMRSYGRTVVARSRYLARNNPQISSAKRSYIAALIGDGIKPSSLITDPALRDLIMQAWLEWTDESDADGLTDFYGQQSIIGGEMFDAGECFVRFRPRLPEDGLSVPLQLQLLPSEMLNHADNLNLPNGLIVRNGVVFSPINKRLGYRFYRERPGDINFTGEITTVPASEVMHVFRQLEAGQVRGIPHTLSAILRAAKLDNYDDNESERKAFASAFNAFITKPLPEDADPVLATGETEAAAAGVDQGLAFEPGSVVTLADGEEITISEPADVGGNYEAYQYRANLQVSAGAGVPYADMTGDLRQASYGSQRAGMLKFRREIGATQNHSLIFQLCRRVWQRWLGDAVLVGAVPIAPSAYVGSEPSFQKAKYIPPKWDWIDPLKDLQAEKLAVDAGFKSRSDVVEAMGVDPEENDKRIAADRQREQKLIRMPSAFAPASPQKPNNADTPPPPDQPPGAPQNGA
ncbi:phage portal protein [Mesorhizobium opportunistum]|uniref:Phage portal protein, lambda family n=1 Tax=Mesorhizobium opportunistum (strain LMG 24607 / HAMBI 3007 / WSM2075) TaxID=536019 RepID=F7XZX2_MESOW|nr:phage portal protein [Mesorhizobium opportunistum]AEH88186.1 phage portal protein, lambda family [Mesorhizobium opportunistum WSM2075]